MGTNFPEVGKFYVISWYNEIPASTWLQNTGRAIYFMYVGIITSTRQGRRYVALVHTDLTVFVGRMYSVVICCYLCTPSVPIKTTNRRTDGVSIKNNECVKNILLIPNYVIYSSYSATVLVFGF